MVARDNFNSILKNMDYRTDQNPKGIHFLLERLGGSAPDYVTAKEAGDASEPTKFALEVTEEFPYSSRKETWMSYAYIKTASDLSEGTKEFVERRLKLAADKFGTSDDLVEIDALVSEFTKEASDKQSTPMRKFALSVERSGEQYDLYPMDTKTQVRSSIASLNNAEGLPIEWQKQASVALVDAAEEKGISRIEIPEKVLHLGVRREPDFEKAASVARHRSHYVKDKEAADLYTEVVKSAAADDEDQLDRYVELMIDLDRAEGINSYGKGIVDPYSAFYSGMETAHVEKIASENAYLMDTLIPTEAFRNTRQYVHEMFSKKAASNLIGMIDTHGKDGVALSAELSRLPLNTQRDLAKLVVARG